MTEIWLPTLRAIYSMGKGGGRGGKGGGCLCGGGVWDVGSGSGGGGED